MIVIDVPKGDGEEWFLVDNAPPHWWPVLGHNGERKAVLSCPKCGCVGSLTKHEIDDAGIVHPSVLMSCSHGEPCWHSENPGVRLVDWHGLPQRD